MLRIGYDNAMEVYKISIISIGLNFLPDLDNAKIVGVPFRWPPQCMGYLRNCPD